MIKRADVRETLPPRFRSVAVKLLTLSAFVLIMVYYDDTYAGNSLSWRFDLQTRHALESVIVPIVIIGDRDRRIPISDGYKDVGLSDNEVRQIYSALGIVVCPAKGVFSGVESTASLTGDNSTIVTAGHDFLAGKGQNRIDEQDCYFSNYAQPTLHIAISKKPNERYMGNSYDKPRPSGGDYAVVHLSRPVKDVTPFKIDPSNSHLEKGTRLVFLSSTFKARGAGLGREPVVQSCLVTKTFAHESDGKGAYLTNCDSDHGDSGALNLVRLPDGSLVVKGINSGYLPGSLPHCTYSDESCANISAELSGPFLDAVRAQSTNKGAKPRARELSRPRPETTDL